MVVNGSIVFGDISAREIQCALAAFYPSRSVKVEDDAEPSAELDNEIVITNYSASRIARLEDEIGEKERMLAELEISSSNAISSVQTFHHQQQQLFDEFVLLRQRYDELKASLLSILWVHCAQYHPELRNIPKLEEMTSFHESEHRIGDYGIGEFLGEGQFACVRACWKLDPKVVHNASDNGRIVYNGAQPLPMAVKTIRKEKVVTLQSLKRVSNEIEILRLLKSPNVIGFYDAIQTDTALHLFTQRGGTDLFDFFDVHPMGVPERGAREIMTCILRAVHYCHEQGICHRDLKPENVLVKFDSETQTCLDLKLCDFGLGTKFRPTVPLNEFCGSPGFFAPEMVIHNAYYGDKADVWSLGCIMLELVLGHEKFCDLWMPPYDYEIMQDRDAFTEHISLVVRELPHHLHFSADMDDFIIRILRLRSSERPVTRNLCLHPWMKCVFEAEWGSFGRTLSSRSTSLSRKDSPGLMDHEPPSLSTSAVRNFMVSTRERLQLELDNEKVGLHLHLPPIEPPTPSIGQARKILRHGDDLVRKGSWYFPDNNSSSQEEPNGGGGNKSDAGKNNREIARRRLFDEENAIAEGNESGKSKPPSQKVGVNADKIGRDGSAATLVDGLEIDEALSTKDTDRSTTTFGFASESNLLDGIATIRSVVSWKGGRSDEVFSESRLSAVPSPHPKRSIPQERFLVSKSLEVSSLANLPSLSLDIEPRVCDASPRDSIPDTSRSVKTPPRRFIERTESDIDALWKSPNGRSDGSSGKRFSEN